MKSFPLVCQTSHSISMLELMRTLNLVLRPNCLLTKDPLVFISGPRSLFSTQKIGHDLQEFIEAHGYQVAPCWMPYRSRGARKRVIQQWLNARQKQRFHLILGASTWIELKETIKNYPQNLATVTVIYSTEQFTGKHSEAATIYKFQNIARVPFHYCLHETFWRYFKMLWTGHQLAAVS